MLHNRSGSQPFLCQTALEYVSDTQMYHSYVQILKQKQMFILVKTSNISICEMYTAIAL